MQASRKILGKSVLIAGCATFCAVSAFASGPVGELEIRGSATISQQGAESSISLRDTTYGWFSGDRIQTRSSHALLNLDAGASFGFAENTVATVSTEGGLVVELDDGTILYAIDENAGAMNLVSGEYTFSTTPAEAQVLQVANTDAGSVGMVRVKEDGSLQVSVQEGVLTARDSSGALQYQVVSGEQVSFNPDRIEQVQVQVEETAAGAGGGGGIVGWAAANPLLAGLAVAVAGYGIYTVAFDDDDDDDDVVDPVSP